MSSMIDDLKSGIDGVLGVRDDLGAELRETYIVTRNWSGDALGSGDPTEIKVRVLPSPRIVDYSQDLRIREGGAVEQGDIVLKMLSKNLFPQKSDVDCSTNAKNIEKFFEVGGILYRVINVVEKQLTWKVQLRPLSNQARS